MAAAPVPAAVLLALLTQDPGYARAESLLAAGRAFDAAQVASALVQRRPRDARARLLLGRAQFARPVVGRYEALAAFRAAAQLAPLDPEPRYWQMEVGFYLGSDEGDRIAREAIIAILAITPDYRDVWTRLRSLYGSPGIWRDIDGALARHPVDPVALRRRAQLAIALLEPARAESLLAASWARQAPDVPAYLVRAEAGFLERRDGDGYAWYDSALARAADDSSEAIWDEVWAIATPEETARYAATVPVERPAFFRAFWDRRDPNLVTAQNERIAEHFARRAEAQRRYRLLHPQRMVYRSAVARARGDMDAGAQREQLADLAPALLGGGAATPDAALARAGLLNPLVRAFQDTALPIAFRAGLSAAGLVYLRHGPPDLQIPCTPDPLHAVRNPLCVSALDSEGWLYRTPTGLFSVSLAGGGEYFSPVSQRQLHSTRVLLHTDHTAVPAPLTARGWTAFFAALPVSARSTAMYARAAPGTAAVALWDSGGVTVARVAGAGLLRLAVAPGEYSFGLDVDSAGVPGRHRGRLAVPAFGSSALALSSLVLAGVDTLADREPLLGLMPADLTYAIGTPLAAYAEVYGLTPDPDGWVRYRVRYTFAPEQGLLSRLFGEAPTMFEFEREARAAEALPERLVIAPGRLAAGRYRVTLVVTDTRRNVKSATAAIVITVR